MPCWFFLTEGNVVAKKKADQTISSSKIDFWVAKTSTGVLKDSISSSGKQVLSWDWNRSLFHCVTKVDAGEMSLFPSIWYCMIWLESYQSTYSCTLRPPRTIEGHRTSCLQVAINLNNSSLPSVGRTAETSDTETSIYDVQYYSFNITTIIFLNIICNKYSLGLFNIMGNITFSTFFY